MKKDEHEGFSVTLEHEQSTQDDNSKTKEDPQPMVTEDRIEGESSQINEESNVDGSIDEANSFDLQELAKDYEDKEHKPRGTLLSLIVTLSFITGPIFLAIDALSPNAFNWSPIDMKIISSSILGLFVIVVIYLAWKRSQ